MQRTGIVLAVALVWSAAGLLACGDDTVLAPPEAGADSSIPADSGQVDSGLADGAEVTDATLDGDADALPPPPSRLLLSYDDFSPPGGPSELVAFGLGSHAVDGRRIYPDFIGTTVSTTSSPWLLEQSLDVVARLDPLQPWIVRSTWNVALNDATDAGFSSSYSDPVAVVVGPGTKAYVLRYTRNLIAVIDTSSDVDGGVPSKTIDLSGFVQGAGDGYVEMTAGFFDPQNNYVYVLLGNINRFDVGCAGYCLLCSSTSPEIVAIDTATDQIVDLAGDAGGDGGGPGVMLPGFSPAFGSAAMAYDPANQRLLVLENGCTQSAPDGGTGATVGREVDGVSLVDGSTTKLLDLSSAAYASGMFYIDAHHVVLQLDSTYMWDPATTVLGAPIPNAPASFGLDGQGNLVGVSQTFAPDGGATGWQVVSVSPADGGVTVLGSQDPFYVDGGDAGNLFSTALGYPNGAQLWPAP